MPGISAVSREMTIAEQPLCENVKSGKEAASQPSQKVNLRPDQDERKLHNSPTPQAHETKNTP